MNHYVIYDHAGRIVDAHFPPKTPTHSFFYANLISAFLFGLIITGVLYYGS